MLLGGLVSYPGPNPIQSCLAPDQVKQVQCYYSICVPSLLSFISLEDCSSATAVFGKSSRDKPKGLQAKP